MITLFILSLRCLTARVLIKIALKERDEKKMKRKEEAGQRLQMKTAQLCDRLAKMKIF